MAQARRADAARNAAAILVAARELFDQRGPDAPFDEVARRAGVGNATLYRHYPTRSDLLVAVYGEEVAELCRRADRPPDGRPPDAALFDWLEEFVVHVASRRNLALAITETADGRRTALFNQWHATITSTADRLLAAAAAGGTIRAQLTGRELLALLSAVAVAGADVDSARRLLAVVRYGLQDPGGGPPLSAASSGPA